MRHEKLNKYEKLRLIRSGLKIRVTASDLKLHQNQNTAIKTGQNLKSFLLNKSMSSNSSDDEKKEEFVIVTAKPLPAHDIVARVIKIRHSSLNKA